MTYTIAIEDGDIQLKGSTMGIVSGLDKLHQELSVWLRERYRSDRFHLTYGSILDNFIGGVIDSGTVAEIRSEVMRILQNYQAVQLRAFKTEPGLFSRDELLVSVDDIETRVEYDRVLVTIRFTNGARQRGATAVAVGVNG